MSEDQNTSEVDMHEDFIQHVEDGSSRTRLLSGISIIVASILILSYLSQLVLPLTGTTTVTVNLADPTNIAVEVAVMVLAIAWLYNGLSNYRFTTNLSKRIAAARAAEAEMEKKLAS